MGSWTAVGAAARGTRPLLQSDLELIRETKQHYAESKLLAEREAWRIIKVLWCLF